MRLTEHADVNICRASLCCYMYERNLGREILGDRYDIKISDDPNKKIDFRNDTY